MRYKVVTPPDCEPVSLADAKTHIRLTTDAITGDLVEDALVQNLIEAAREYCENYAGVALAEQTVEAHLDGFPRCSSIELPLPPLRSVDSVKYKDSTGTTTTLTEGEDYLVDTDSAIGRIVTPYGKSWPQFTPWPINPVTICYTAGYTAAPKTIRQAMLLLVGHWYANREATDLTPGTRALEGEIEFATKALMSMYRVRWM